MKNSTPKKILPNKQQVLKATPSGLTKKPTFKPKLQVVTPGLGTKKVVAGVGRKLMARELANHANSLKKIGGLRGNLSMGRAGDAAKRLAQKFVRK